MDANRRGNDDRCGIAPRFAEGLVNGKGDSPRPLNRNQYESNYDEIKWNDRRSVDCKSCKVGCRYFAKTGMVCFPVSKQQEPEQVRLCDERKKKAEDQGQRSQAHQKKAE